MKLIKLLNKIRVVDSHSLLKCIQCRCSSTVVQKYDYKDSGQPQTENLRKIFRTTEEDPLRHSWENHGLYYTISKDDISAFMTRGLSNEFKKQIKTFNEACFMIRKPALEIFDILRTANISNIVHKLIIYGRCGSGKSMTLSHVQHYGIRDGWLIVQLPWPKLWNMYSSEIVVSQYDQNRIDLPLYAMGWLADFKLHNAQLLQNYKTGKEYTWTKRDRVEENSPIMDVVDFGLNRGKFANDAVGIVVKEIKRHACEKGMKVMVLIDGINAFWAPTKLTVKQWKGTVPAEKISLVHHFKKLLNSDWTNAFVIATVDRNASILEQREEFTPRYLLGKEGFNTLEPFIPIFVDDYSDKEIHSCLQYYLDRNWIQNEAGRTEEGMNEFIFRSCKNPYKLMEAVGPW